MSKPLAHLAASAVRAIHHEVLEAHGGATGIRDEGLLEFGRRGAASHDDGRSVDVRPNRIAAAYLFYLCRNHPFIDGNERTALAACLVFLESNDLLADEKLPIRDWEAFVLDVATSRLDRDQTTARLRKLLKRRRASRWERS